MSSDVIIIHPAPPLPADEETIQEVRRELDTIKTEKPIATASTPEYYQKNKEGSYAIDARHTTRGRALIVTMTADRKGWKADVKELQKIFISLDIETEYIFDPDSSMLFGELCKFAEDDKNDDVDCSFVVFMGHGCANGNNTYLQTMDEHFDIFGNCKLIFSSDSSKLKEKPKLIVAQMCRKQRNIPADDAIALNQSQTKTFQHYLLLLSCNPGEFANRDQEHGSWYIQHLATMMEKSHDHHVEKIVKKISKLFDKMNKENPTRVQVPQQITSLTQKINMFPGITEPQEEEQIPQGTPGEVVSENEPGGGNVDSQNYEVCPKLTMQISPKTKPEEAVNTVTKELVDEIRRDDGTKLGDYFSKQLKTQLRMNQVYEGSIKIDWCISDLSELEEIKSMSDTGILSNLSTYFLVTPELRNKCAVDKIFLKTVIDEGSYEKLMKHAEDKNKVVNSLLRQTQDISSLENEAVRIVSDLKGYGEVKWYKDSNEIKDGDNIRIEAAEGKSTVVIQHCQPEHTGMYRCVSQVEARKFIHDQYLYVDGMEAVDDRQSQSVPVDDIQHHKTVLSFSHDYLIKTLECSLILDELICRHVITQNELDYIKTEPERQRKTNPKVEENEAQVIALLKCLETKESHHYETFCDCLDATGQEHIRDELRLVFDHRVTAVQEKRKMDKVVTAQEVMRAAFQIVTRSNTAFSPKVSVIHGSARDGSLLAGVDQKDNYNSKFSWDYDCLIFEGYLSEEDQTECIHDIANNPGFVCVDISTFTEDKFKECFPNSNLNLVRRDKNIFLSAFEAKFEISTSQQVQHDIRGAAIQNDFEGALTNCHLDEVPCIACCGWPSIARTWINRDRFWPTKTLVEDITNSAYHLVHKPSISGDLEIEWRLSFSLAETKLMDSVTGAKLAAYCICKEQIKKIMSTNLTTYHFKTVFFWFCEKQTSDFWQLDQVDKCVGALLDFLIDSFYKGMIPHYFIHRINLLKHIPQDALAQIKLELIEIKAGLKISHFSGTTSGRDLVTIELARIKMLRTSCWELLQRKVKNAGEDYLSSLQDSLRQLASYISVIASISCHVAESKHIDKTKLEKTLSCTYSLLCALAEEVNSWVLAYRNLNNLCETISEPRMLTTTERRIKNIEFPHGYYRYVLDEGTYPEGHPRKLYDTVKALIETKGVQYITCCSELTEKLNSLLDTIVNPESEGIWDLNMLVDTVKPLLPNYEWSDEACLSVHQLAQDYVWLFKTEGSHGVLRQQKKSTCNGNCFEKRVQEAKRELFGSDVNTELNIFEVTFGKEHSIYAEGSLIVYPLDPYISEMLKNTLVIFP